VFDHAGAGEIAAMTTQAAVHSPTLLAATHTVHGAPALIIILVILALIIIGIVAVIKAVARRVH
jgi:hypothetical protein